MLDEPLQAAIDHERSLTQELGARLAPRRAAESAELNALAEERDAVRRRHQAATGGLERAQTEQRRLAERRTVLEQGLSAARRSWLRLGEPVLGALLLFFSLTAVGAAIRHHLETAGLEALGFFAGAVLSRWRPRRWAR